jgi:hypothetical protein
MPTRKKTAGHGATALLTIVATLIALGLASAAAQAEPVFEAVEIGESEEWNEEIPVHATLDATQVEAEPVKLKLGALTVTCATVTASATLATESTTATFAPKLEKCKVVILGITFPTEVKMGSCHYVLHAKEEVEEDLSTASADLTCEGKEEKILITIKNPAGTKTTCLIHVPPQSGLSTVEIENLTEASPEDIKLKNKVESIVAQVTKGEEPCLIAAGTYENGALTGSTTVTATGTGEVKVPPVKVKSKKYDFEWESANEIQVIQDVGSSQEFSFAVGKVKCNTMYLWRAVFASISDTIIQDPQNFEECKLGGQEVEFNFRECRYWFIAGTFELNEFVGNTKITCPVNRFIEVIAPECKIKIFEQDGKNHEGLKRVTYMNQKPGARQEVTGEMHLRSIEYEEEGEGVGCNNNMLRTDGKYDGKFLMQAGITGGLQGELWVERT